MKHSGVFFLRTFRLEDMRIDHRLAGTVNSLLMDTSIRDNSVKWTPRVGPCLFLLLNLSLTLHRTDVSLRRTLSAGPEGVHLREC